MKIKKIVLNNFAKFTNFALEFDNKVTRLVGLNGSGKTTIGYTAIWAGLKGITEKAGSGGVVGERFRFIGNAGKTSDIEIQLLDEKTGETITCKNHITKDSNKITFTSSTGRQLTNEWINGLFNFVFMSAKNFCQLSGKEQALKLGIDVSKIDAEIKNLKSEFTLINRELKGFGVLIEPEKIESIDVSVLNQKKDVIRKNLNDIYLKNVKHNKLLRDKYNSDIANERSEFGKFNTEQSDLAVIRSQIHNYISCLVKLGYTGKELDLWFKSLPIPQPQKINSLIEEPIYITELPDDSELASIDNEIAQASITNQKAALYTEYLKDKAKRDAKEKELTDNKAAQDAKEKKKVDYIKSFKFGFEGISVDEDGDLLLTGRPIREPYFSKGELEVIVAKIASSIKSEWKTRFIDDFDLLDEVKQEKLLKELIDAGYQVITAEVGTAATKDGSIVLRECKVDDGVEKISLF